MIRFAAASILTLATLSNSELTLAHGGGLDQYGCHHERATGGYHCHRSGYTRRYENSSEYSAPSPAPAPAPALAAPTPIARPAKAKTPILDALLGSIGQSPSGYMPDSAVEAALTYQASLLFQKTGTPEEAEKTRHELRYAIDEIAKKNAEIKMLEEKIKSLNEEVMAAQRAINALRK